MLKAIDISTSGLVAQRQRMNTIAGNIANVNTTGFKRNRLNFRDLLYRTLREPGSSTVGNQMNPTGLQIGSGTEISNHSERSASNPAIVSAVPST